MDYFYDITLNFNEKELYFFEWDIIDTIHIKKIPFFKVDTKTLVDIKNNIVKIDKTFIKKISQKTETFNGNKITAFLISDGNSSLGILFDNKCLISTLLLDEEDDIISCIRSIPRTIIEYVIKEKRKERNHLTINQENKINYLIKEIKDAYQHDHNKLNYLYYECLNKNYKNQHEAYEYLNKIIYINNDILNNLYNILNLIKK